MECKIVTKTKKLEQTNNFIFKKLTLSYYKGIVKKEIKLASIKKEDKVLCIGGGCFPCTAILIAKLTKANVVVIDNDHATIQYAKEKIKSYGLENQIEILLTDGVDIDASNFDIVCIANQITPKEEVLDKVKSTIKTGKVIVRIPKKCLKGCYQNCNEIDGIFIKGPFYSNIGRTYICHVNESYN